MEHSSKLKAHEAAREEGNNFANYKVIFQLRTNAERELLPLCVPVFVKVEYGTVTRMLAAADVYAARTSVLEVLSQVTRLPVDVLRHLNLPGYMAASHHRLENRQTLLRLAAAKNSKQYLGKNAAGVYRNTLADKRLRQVFLDGLEDHLVAFSQEQLLEEV